MALGTSPPVNIVLLQAVGCRTQSFTAPLSALTNCLTENFFYVQFVCTQYALWRVKERFFAIFIMNRTTAVRWLKSCDPYVRAQIKHLLLLITYRFFPEKLVKQPIGSFVLIMRPERQGHNFVTTRTTYKKLSKIF